MNILDKPSRFNGTSIPVPLFHRGHLSLFPGAKVWLCLIPKTSKNQFTELVVSPIHHDAWTDLWRISITLRERVGLVHDVFQILAHNSINIVTVESSTRDAMSLHSIEMIADAKLYNGPLSDLTHEQRSGGQLEELSDLRTEILARLIDDVEFLPNGSPRLQIRRVRSLFNARRHYNDAHLELHDDLKPKPIIRETIVRKSERMVTIPLPEDIRRTLFDALGKVDSSEDGVIGYFLTVSNTSERFLHIYFMKEADLIIAPTIEHQDEIGALAKISGAIQTAGFNILTTLSRLYQWETRARTEFVLQPPPKNRGRVSIKQMKQNLEGALSTPELVDRYGIRVGYPTNYMTPLKTKRLVSISSAYPSGHSAGVGWSPSRSVETVMNSKQRELRRKRQNGDASPRDLMAEMLLDSLDSTRSHQAALKNSHRRGSLFISYSFNNSVIHERVKTIAGKRFDVVEGKKLGRADTTRQGIMALMEPCTHFLGIWTAEGGTALEGGDYYPSPWLHWEWGVADAFGLSWHLLISKKINVQAWQRIAGSTPHTLFDDLDLEDRLKDAIKLL